MATIITCGSCRKFLEAYKSAEKLMRIENKVYGRSDDIVVGAFINKMDAAQEQIIKSCRKLYVVDGLGYDIDLITLASLKNIPVTFVHDVIAIYNHKSTKSDLLSLEEYVNLIRHLDEVKIKVRGIDNALKNVSSSISGKYIEYKVMFDKENVDTEEVMYKDILGITFKICNNRKLWIA